MEEEPMFIKDLDLQIFYELADILHKDNCWENLVPLLPIHEKLALNFLQANRHSISSSPDLLKKFLLSINMTIKAFMVCLQEADLTNALEVITADEPLVLIADIPDTFYVKNGKNLHICCFATGFPTPKYQWFKGEDTLEEQTTNALILSSVNDEDGGVYTCRIHKPNRDDKVLDHIFTSWCNVKVQPSKCIDTADNEIGNAPHITLQPEMIVIEKGEGFDLTCKVQSHPLPKYLWYKDGNPTNCCTHTFTVTEACTYDQGNYKCHVSNIHGFTWTDAVTVEICSQAQFSRIDVEIIRHPTCLINSLNYGDHIFLECEVKSRYPVTYQWHKGQHPIPDSDKNIFKFVNDNASDKEEVWNVCCTVNGGKKTVVSNQTSITFKTKDKLGHYVSEDKIALLIGNQAYDDLNELYSPTTDVETVAKMLHQMQFKVISLMNLSLVEIRNIVKLLLGMLDPGVYVLFYYAGHGFQVANECYLVPVDARNTFALNECYNIEDFVEKMLEKKVEFACLILDTCLKEPENLIPTKSVRKRKAKTQQNIMYSYSTVCSAAAYEYRKPRNGIYVSHLKKHMMLKKSVHNLLFDVMQEFKDKKISQVPWLAGNLARPLSLWDPIVESSTKFENRTLQWKKIIELPEDRLIRLDDLNLILKVNFKKFNDVFCNTMVMELCVQKKDNCSPIPCNLKKLAVIPVFKTGLQDFPVGKFNQKHRHAEFRCSLIIYDLQKIQHPMEIDLKIIDGNNLEPCEISKLNMCIGEPMISKFMLWKNFNFNETKILLSCSQILQNSA